MSEEVGVRDNLALNFRLNFFSKIVEENVDEIFDLKNIFKILII